MSIFSDIFGGLDKGLRELNEGFDQVYSQDFLGGLNAGMEDTLGNLESLTRDEDYQKAAAVAMMYYGGGQMMGGESGALGAGGGGGALGGAEAGAGAGGFSGSTGALGGAEAGGAGAAGGGMTAGNWADLGQLMAQPQQQQPQQQYQQPAQAPLVQYQPLAQLAERPQFNTMYQPYGQAPLTPLYPPIDQFSPLSYNDLQKNNWGF